MAALNYNLKKLNHPDPKLRAELLDSNFTSLDRERIKQEVDLVKSLKPNLNKYVYHTSLNFPKEDRLDNRRLLNIAHEYLRQSGFTNNQYLIFRHHDADHPHIHLLVNRVSFDGKVVSDSNNYKRSEAILRKLEIKYGLQRVSDSDKARSRAVKKNELEMVMRTGKPSDKMMLQELMKKLLNEGYLSITDLITKGEALGINFFFNQATTGRISGVTYFINGFKIRGQALGNQFKWASIIKKVAYEQNRDGKAISDANGRTTSKYPSGEGNGGRSGSHSLFNGYPVDTSVFPRQSGNTTGHEKGTGRTTANIEGSGYPDNADRERSLETGQDAHISNNSSADHEYSGADDQIGFEISDDVDDEAVYGKSRRRKDRDTGYSR